MILAVKLHMPPLRPQFVPRERLTAQLQGALNRKLCLLVAPAGFGKTTLMREWVEASAQNVAWLSLDEQDNVATRFITYVIHAFREIDPALGEQSLTLLNAAHSPDMTAVLTHLVNDLAASHDPLVLILDDYHVIDDPATHDALDFLIAHAPPRVHLIIASRSQPPLNVARLRGQGQLLELDSADLRFTAVEVEKFLKDVMRLDLSPADRIALEMRTEGWIAGVQLAGISLQAQEDQSAFIKSFSGADRYISDYLFEEALERQPDDVQRFLLYTSVLDALSGDLCDAVLDRNDSQAMLERLDSLSLFIVPLDNQREWYRYHHLFGELLRHHLSRTHPELESSLHARASLWFERKNRLDDAIRHGLIAEDFARSATLIESAFESRSWVQGDMRRLLDWFDALPDTVTRARPKLILAYAWLSLEIFADRWDDSEAHLQRAENILVSPLATDSYVDVEIRRMLAQVNLLRANHARHANQPERVIALCEQALAQLPEDDMYIRSGVTAHLASAYEMLGALERASAIYAESVRMCRLADNVDGLLFAAARLIETLTVCGQLRQAEIVFEQTHEYAETRTGPDIGMVYINIAEVYREQNRLEQARIILERGLQLCRPFEAWRAGVIAGSITLARILSAEGRYDEAMEILSKIEIRYPKATPQERARIESAAVRLSQAQGEFTPAARWAADKISAFDDADYVHEFESLTLIRVLIMQASLEAQGVRPATIVDDPIAAAQTLLERLEANARSGGRIGRVMEIVALKAMVHVIKQETREALDCLSQTLTLAEPEGHIRLFVDEDAPMRALLTVFMTKRPPSVSADAINAILAAFPQSVSMNVPYGGALTDSELRALRLLATEREISEIAEELSVSISTVRTYAKRIYSKLDAHSRAEAVYRARELKLL